MPDPNRASGRQRPNLRALGVCAVVVLILHAAFLGGLAGPKVGFDVDASVPAMAVRTIAAAATSVAAPSAANAAPAEAAAPLPASATSAEAALIVAAAAPTAQPTIRSIAAAETMAAPRRAPARPRPPTGGGSVPGAKPAPSISGSDRVGRLDRVPAARIDSGRAPDVANSPKEAAVARPNAATTDAAVERANSAAADADAARANLSSIDAQASRASEPTTDAVPSSANAPAIGIAAAPTHAPAGERAEAATVDVASRTTAAQSPLLAPGESPPPTYRTRLPPAVTLRYQVRRGFLRGSGEIRWRPAGERYALTLEAQIAGLTLLAQSSEGAIEADGLAPLRFVERRARRSAQAANFRRDAGTIAFSGPSIEWPLLAGAQDRLSWMVQLAGIAAAEPQRLVEGGRIGMMVASARGDAAIWTFRFAGRENVDVTGGTVAAIKLVRDARAMHDTSAEVWLDPERSFLPARATLRNSAGESDYDLLLERVEPAR